MIRSRLPFRRTWQLKILPVGLLGLVLAACFGNGIPADRTPVPSSGGSGPELFLPGIVSTGLNERDAAMTSDGSEFYFTIWTGSSGVIMVSRTSGKRWLEPVVASFSGVFSDLEPALSPDGSRLYFASSRPTGGDSQAGDYNVWYVKRDDSSWSDPRIVPAPVSTPEDEYYPSLTTAGELYFTSGRNGGAGGEDIWRALPSDSGFSRVEPVPGGVNTDRDEFNSFVAPDGSYLLFSSWGRPDGLGGGDLYVSFRNGADGFGPAINLGGPVNSAGLDYSPFVSRDSTYLYFSSRRTTYERPADGWSYAELTEALASPGNGQGDVFRFPAAVLDSLRSAVSR